MIKKILLLICFIILTNCIFSQVRFIDIKLKILSPLPYSYIKSPGLINMKFSIYNKGIDSIYKTDTMVCYFTTNDSHFKYRHLYFSNNVVPNDSEVFNIELPFNSKFDNNFWNLTANCAIFNRSNNWIVQETSEQMNDNTDRMFLKHRSATSQVNNVYKDNLILFPNPVDNELFINSNLEISKILIFDVTGKKVKEITDYSILKSGRIPSYDLKNNLYILTIYAKNQIIKSKFLVNHL